MGNWNLNIQGLGCHGNKSADIDVDIAAAEFIEKLRKMGQHIEKATFTFGGKQDLTPTSISDVKPKNCRSSLP